jgi:UDP-N-acetylmuramoylalanine--D-glutamate ligase
MQLPFAQGKHYGVLGLGKSGRSVVASLHASGANITAWDDGEASRVAVQQSYGDVKMLQPDAWDWAALSALIISPGIPHSHAAVTLANQHGVEVIGDIELCAHANPDAQFITITGTNGKSTTTSLIAHILLHCSKRMEVGGNLGIPVLDLPVLGGNGAYVLELSSYQLEAVKSLHSHVAVWLNISPDHLDHHGSMEAYVDAKKHIFNNQASGDFIVIGVDDATSESVAREMITKGSSKVIPISGRTKVAGGIFVQNGMLTNAMSTPQQTADLRSIKSLQGEHNGQNAAAAYAACIAYGCAHEAIIAAMHSYVGLPHRMQWLGEVNGIRFVNDSKATNADAAEKSLRTYDNIFWIAGGVAKEGGIESLGVYFPKIRHAFLIGESAEMFSQTLDEQVPYTRCNTLENAFEAAVKQAATNGGTVLLAPACASFDQFANFEKRGEAFAQLVCDYAAQQNKGSYATTA